MERITSASNPNVQALRSLRDGKGRRERGWFLVEGPKMLGEARRAGAGIELVLVDEDRPDLLEGWTPPARTFLAPARIIEGAADTRTPQGIVAAVRLPGEPGAYGQRVVALDGVQDPGNAGTIWRTAEAAGFAGIVFGEGSVDPYAPKCVRATMGSVFRVPAYVGSLEERLAALRDAGYAIVASSLRAPSASHLRIEGPCALVVGSEGAGIRPQIERLATHRARLPMAGQVESLNAAVASALFMYALGGWFDVMRGLNLQEGDEKV